jgi:hypothetical protein
MQLGEHMTTFVAGAKGCTDCPTLDVIAGT